MIANKWKNRTCSKPPTRSVLDVFSKEIRFSSQITWRFPKSWGLPPKIPKSSSQFQPWMTIFCIETNGIPMVIHGAEGRQGRPTIDWPRKCRGKPWEAPKERRSHQPRPVFLCPRSNHGGCRGAKDISGTMGRGCLLWSTDLQLQFFANSWSFYT